MRTVLRCIAATILPTAASAQIAYRIDQGNVLAMPANATIDLGDLAQDTFLHIYDSSGFDESIGLLTIRGSSLNGAKLFVQIANEAETPVFGRPATQPIAAGLRDFGGLRVENAADPNDTSLRDRTILAAAVLGDFITAFFSEDPAERARCDFNEDGFVEPGDLDDFITAFFTGC